MIVLSVVFKAADFYLKKSESWPRFTFDYHGITALLDLQYFLIEFLFKLVEDHTSTAKQNSGTAQTALSSSFGSAWWCDFSQYDCFRSKSIMSYANNPTKMFHSPFLVIGINHLMWNTVSALLLFLEALRCGPRINLRLPSSSKRDLRENLIFMNRTIRTNPAGFENLSFFCFSVQLA